jgi:hypothetical protein
MISYKWEPLVLFPANALSICHMHGASTHVLLPLTMKLYLRTQQQCTQSQATQTRVKGENRKPDKAKL